MDDEERALREQQASTWWVGRGRVRPWPWAGPLCLLLLAVMATSSWAVDPATTPLWPVVVSWGVTLSYAGWVWWCLRTGHDPTDTRLDRWAQAHPARSWLLLGLLAIVVASVVLLMR